MRACSVWRRVELASVSRAYRTPRIIDQRIGLDDYQGDICQIAIADLGHEEPDPTAHQPTPPLRARPDRGNGQGAILEEANAGTDVQIGAITSVLQPGSISAMLRYVNTPAYFRLG